MPVDIEQEFNLGVDKSGQPISISGTPYTSQEGLFAILSVIVKNVFVIAGIVLFILIIVGGLGMILNAGNAEKQQKSNNVLGSAVTGFVIMIISYWIIKIIEVITGVEIISL